MVVLSYVDVVTWMCTYIHMWSTALSSNVHLNGWEWLKVITYPRRDYETEYEIRRIKELLLLLVLLHSMCTIECVHTFTCGPFPFLQMYPLNGWEWLKIVTYSRRDYETKYEMRGIKELLLLLVSLHCMCTNFNVTPIRRMPWFICTYFNAITSMTHFTFSYRWT